MTIKCSGSHAYELTGHTYYKGWPRPDKAVLYGTALCVQCGDLIELEVESYKLDNSEGLHDDHTAHIKPLKAVEPSPEEDSEKGA